MHDIIEIIYNIYYLLININYNFDVNDMVMIIL